MIKESKSRKIFLIANGTGLILYAFVCLVPFFNLLAVSLSSAGAVESGTVTFIPVEFTFNAYEFLLAKKEFFTAFGYSVLRVVLGTVISMVVMILGAYPLSRDDGEFTGRTFYAGFFIVTMFFSGGLVPTFIIMTKLNLLNRIWALVLPSAMNAWNMVLLINFFRQIPKEMIEAAKLEGAGHMTILLKMVLPVSLPALATVILFTAVQHWNSWFDGVIYMNPEKFPLQSYIYNMINEYNTLAQSTDPEKQALLENLPGKTLRSAQIFVAMIPIMLVYPFAQKYFVKGLVMGSVKE